MEQTTHEYSSFPQEIIKQHHFKDVDDNIASVVNQIKTLQSKGLYNQAARVVDNNRDVLGQYIIDSSLINEMIEQIRNTQLYALQQQQCVFYGNKPLTCNDGDIWIGV